MSNTPGGNDPDEKEALERLKRLGYRVRKPGRFVKYTVLVNEHTLRDFKAALSELDYQVQEAVTEALDQWLTLRRSEIESRKKKR